MHITCHHQLNQSLTLTVGSTAPISTIQIRSLHLNRLEIIDLPFINTLPKHIRHYSRLEQFHCWLQFHNQQNRIKRGEMEAERRDERLKHLGFVRAAAITAVVSVAKRKAGPLKPAVDAAEGVVTAVVEPVYRKFHGVPDEFLFFVDHKVDTATAIFDEQAPPVAKQVVGHLHMIINKATKTAQEMIHQAQVGGPFAAAHYAAAESKEFVLTQTVNILTKLDRFPPFHVVAEIAVPTAAHLSDKYNTVVMGMSRRGYPVFGFLPLVPLDEIAKAFKQAAEMKAPSKEVAAE